MKTYAKNLPKAFAGLVWACCLVLSACRETPPSFSSGDVLPTSQPKGNSPVPISARLLERLEPSSRPTFGSVQYGSAIALYGDSLVVGASERHGMPGYGKGTVYVYQREGENWVESAQLTASDEDDGFQTDLYFGSALAMDAETLFVGAPAAKDPATGVNVGAVYVFQLGEAGWEEVEILYPSEPTAGANFG